MKVPFKWLQDLVAVKESASDLSNILSLKTIGTKEVTPDFIELDMKGYNRADLLSMRGVAREVAAITDAQVNLEETTNFIWGDKSLAEMTVEVKNQDLCPLYCLVKIEGVKGDDPSPVEWLEKLNNAGLRGVTALADITNLVMLEYGQPLHAFDAEAIKNETIIVRTATKGEQLVTLDGKERNLEENDLLIADSEKAVGLAGVMGGKNSEVKSPTNTILLEAAIFDPITLRKTASRLSLHSEASKRFQHGLTRKNLLLALNKAVQMILEYYPESKMTAMAIVGETEDRSKTILLTHSKVNALIGVEVSAEQIVTSLTKLGFKITSDKEGEWEIEVPYWRLDIERQEDLIEEVARLYDFTQIPSQELPGTPPEQIDQQLFESIRKIKTTLVDLGLIEVQTYSFYSTNALNYLGWKDHTEHLVTVANPMSTETKYLRQHIWQNLIDVVDKNNRKGYKDIAIFELGKVYYPQKDAMPKEEYRISIMLMNGTSSPIQELYAIYQRLVDSLKLNFETKTESSNDPIVKMYFLPNRSIQVYNNGQIVGGITELHPRVTDKYGISQRVATFEINLDPLLSTNTK